MSVQVFGSADEDLRPEAHDLFYFLAEHNDWKVYWGKGGSVVTER